jgi:hypothetical protein
MHPRKIFPLILIVAIVLAACSPPLPAPVATSVVDNNVQRNVQAQGTDEGMCVFFGQTADSTPIWLGDCQGVEATAVPATDTSVPDTETPAPTDTVVPSATIVASPTTTAVLTATAITGGTVTATKKPAASATPSSTPLPVPSETSPPTNTPAPTETLPPTGVPQITATSFPTSAPQQPFRGAPLCVDPEGFHDPSHWHALWNAERGCHYDNEHGHNPLTADVAAAFPHLDWLDFHCGVEIGHCNPSSPIENDATVGKHTGFKVDVVLDTFTDCNGFEGTPTGAKSAVVMYHSFGDQSREYTARVHSVVFHVKQCRASNTNDFGYVSVTTWQDYGQRISPYQGDLVNLPDQPQPAYDPPRGPYLSLDCVGTKTGTLGQPGHRGECRPSLQQVLTGNNGQGLNVAAVWAGKPTGIGGTIVRVNVLGQILFRVIDTPQLLDWTTYNTTPRFLWLCSNDGGQTYAPKVGCKYNNSTTTVQEIQGEVPAAWDQSSFDTDTRVGRFSGVGYSDRYGAWVPSGACVQPGTNCFRVKFTNAFIGKWGAALVDNKGPFDPAILNERDICFTSAGALIDCRQPSSLSAGWIGVNN